ncbi:MAG TPA: hypothetical protein VGR26_13350 [Acidimicrobiales bacterium]|nr:hypothetical protein [Acidimicrobiales bacterium]
MSIFEKRWQWIDGDMYPAWVRLAESGTAGDAEWRPTELSGLAVAFFVQDLDGSSERPTATFRFVSLLDELERATAEHGDVAVTHESGWTLTVFGGGRVAWEREGPLRREALPQAPGAALGDLLGRDRRRNYPSLRFMP